MKKKRKNLPEKVFEKLAAEIRSGAYPTGTFLPTEYQLCERLEVSRGTLRSALKLLEAEGLTRTCPGKGSYVMDHVTGERRLERFITGSCGGQLPKAGEMIKLLNGVCRKAVELHAEVIVAFEDIQRPDRLIDRYASGNIDGVIHIECVDYDGLVAPLEKAGVPCVVANLEMEMPAAAAKVDFRSVGRTAAQCLLRHGHRNIGVLMGSYESFLYRELLAGFRGALAEEEVNLPKSSITVTETWSARDSYDASMGILKGKKRPTAIFATRDIRAAGCFRACAELGLTVPDDLSIVSYDDITWAEAAHFGLTTVTEPADEMGAAAVDLLARWIATGNKPESVVFPGELVTRSSVAPPRLDA